MYKDYYKKQQYTVRNEGYKDEPMLIIAEDLSGRIVHIKEVPNGLDCNCICPKCRQRLVAKNNIDNERQSHFAHYDSSSNCHGAYMSAIHKLAEQIIYEEKMVMAPAYGSIDNTKLVFTEVELEKRVDRSDLQPDIVGITADGNRWAIEIRYTNEIDSKKTKKIKESKMICLEIDVRNQEQDKEKLKRFLTESTDYREWINNPLYDSIIAEEEKEKVNAIEKCLLNSKTLPISGCDLCKPMTVQIKSIDVLDNRNSGCYSIVKVMSMGDIPYIIHIANQNILSDVYNSNKKFVIDELAIVTDQIPSNNTISIDSLQVLWFTTYTADTFKNLITEQYDRNPAFNNKFLSFCKKHPNYRSLYYENFFTQEVIKECVSEMVSKLEDDINTESYRSGRNVVEGFLDFNNDNNRTIKKYRYFSLDEFFSEHKRTLTYMLENGVSAAIRNIEKVEGMVFILCKVPTDNNQPFHIYSIVLDNAMIKSSKVGSFTNLADAKCMFLITSFFRKIMGQSF